MLKIILVRLNRTCYAFNLFYKTDNTGLSYAVLTPRKTAVVDGLLEKNKRISDIKIPKQSIVLLLFLKPFDSAKRPLLPTCHLNDFIIGVPLISFKLKTKLGQHGEASDGVLFGLRNGETIRRFNLTAIIIYY